MGRMSLGWAVAVVAAAGAARASAAVAYTVTDLGTLGGPTSSSSATAINNGGQVVGDVESAQGVSQAVLFGRGTVTPIIGGDAGSHAEGINDAGQIVGRAGTVAYVTTVAGGAVTPLGMLPAQPGGADVGPRPTDASAINNAGLAVGVGLTSFDDEHAARFDTRAGTATDLGPIQSSQYSNAFAVNAAGVAAGDLFRPGGHDAALFGPDGTIQVLHAPGLDGDQPSSVAYGVNDAGDVVGVAGVDLLSGDVSPDQAFVYHDGTFTNLGGLPGRPASEADAINNAGQIVGESFSQSAADGVSSRAFLYQDGAMVALDTLDPAGSPFTSLDIADAVNDAGQIVGSGTLADGDVHAFLLSPTAVPEPTAAAAVAVAALSLGRRRRRAGRD